VLCEGSDPYELEEKCLRDEVTELPDVTSIDDNVYLVNSTDFYTYEQMKAHESLEAHTYYFHVNGSIGIVLKNRLRGKTGFGM